MSQNKNVNVSLQGETQEGLITLDGETIDVDYDPDDSFHQIVSHKAAKARSPGGVDEEGEELQQEAEPDQEAPPSFAVVIQVERALHLPLIKDKQKWVEL